MKPMRPWHVTAGGIVLALTGCAQPPTTTPTPTTCEAPCTATPTTARTASASAPAKPATTTPPANAPARTATRPSADVTPPYTREQFGAGWADPDHNGCDARQDAVRKATTNRVYDGKCKIVVADVYDRYSGRTYKAAKTSSFDIDHVVSLHDAWQSGASKWTRARRIAYANDPSVLVLTTASANRSKSDQGPDTWSPVSHDGACWYVRTYRNIKRVWALHTTPGQRAAIKRTLTTC